MKKKILVGIATGYFLLSLTALSMASNISVFGNSSFVSQGERDNFIDALLSLGHNISLYEGYDLASFSAVIASGDILAFPEMENGNLYDALDGPTRTLLQNYVSGGGGIVQANRFPNNENLPNGLFGWSLGGFETNLGTTALTAAAVGTSFEGGPTTLPELFNIDGVSMSTLPGAAISIYDDGTYSSVFGASFGSGKYVFLGYDWFGGQNTDWSAALDRSVSYVSTDPVPEPATMLLLGTGLVGVAGAARRKKKNQA